MKKPGLIVAPLTPFTGDLSGTAEQDLVCAEAALKHFYAATGMRPQASDFQAGEVHPSRS